MRVISLRQLNHDFLKNRYLTFVFARQEIINKLDNNEEILKRLLEWRDNKNAFSDLLNSAERAFSPLLLLAQSPLSSLPEEDKEWIGLFIHELYCARTGIREKIAILKEKIFKVDNLVTEIVDGGGRQDAGKRLYQACQELSNGISALPSEIMVL